MAQVVENLPRNLVAHICNLSYSGGKNQKDYGWKPTQANSS
jgi:hypothetical protein